MYKQAIGDSPSPGQCGGRLEGGRGGRGATGGGRRKMRADLLRKLCLFTDNTEAARECVPSDLACFKRTCEEKMNGAGD